MKSRDTNEHRFFWDEDTTCQSLFRIETELLEHHPNYVVREKMKDYLLASSIHCEMRYGLEYLYLNGYFHELSELIEKNRTVSSELNEQWADVYDLLLFRYRTAPDPHYFLKQVDRIEPLEEDMAQLKTMMVIYGNATLRRYHYLGLYVEQLRTYIQRMNNPFLKRLFQFRLDEILFNYHWKRNEVILARKHAYKLIYHSQNTYKMAIFHNVLAYTYIFESYDQAMHHAHQALANAEYAMFDNIHKIVTHNTIPFIASVFEKPNGITTEDEGEQIHLMIARGETVEASRRLREMSSLSPFKQYYLGKAEQNADMLLTSYQRLIQEQSDYFFARLPLLELEKIRSAQVN
ncbi:AimR family lysis-lysogeny pheromone receptor [Pontibacillus salicampi]|uniref:AimR family lysis-lysogeny pheromone receptor n=1 Tax=Pontibacillus salicampi TaxID=1449801 RepID=A0ABV6LS05_9BACI